MPASFPGSMPDVPSLSNPVSSDPLNVPSHASQHGNANDAIEALAAEVVAAGEKVGIGASTPTLGTFFIGTATGTSEWGNTVTAVSAGTTPLVLKGASSQTGDLFQLKTSAGTVFTQLRASGEEDGLMQIVQTFTDRPTTDHYSGVHSQLVARGTSSLASQLRTIGFYADIADQAAVVTKNVSGTATSGGLIRITTSTAHGLTTGDHVAVYGVTGTTAANGYWPVTVIDTTHIDLQGSVYAGAYVSGGKVTNQPMLAGFHAAIGPRVDRDDFTGTALHGADTVAYSAQNTGTGKGTDCFYIAQSTGVTGSAWRTGYAVDADIDNAFYIGAHTFDVGLNMRYGTYSTAPILLPNNGSVSAMNTDGVTVQPVWKFDLNNRLAFQAQLFLGAGVNIHVDTASGAKIGTASNEKMGFWGVTPVVRPTGWGAPTGTATRTTFATGSVTLSQLAERVRGLIDDLTTIGVIGT